MVDSSFKVDSASMVDSSPIVGSAVTVDSASIVDSAARVDSAVSVVFAAMVDLPSWLILSVCLLCCSFHFFHGRLSKVFVCTCVAAMLDSATGLILPR